MYEIIVSINLPILYGCLFLVAVAWTEAGLPEKNLMYKNWKI
jgi:hypothetical protein